MQGKKAANAEIEEVVDKKKVVLSIDMTKGDVQRLSEALKTIFYGDMSAAGKMSLVKNSMAIIKKSKELDEERKLAYEGLIPEEFKKLGEKQRNGEELTSEESEEFSRMNRQYGMKLQEMYENLDNEKVVLRITPLSVADYKILLEANKNKITGDGFVSIYQYLIEQED